MNLFRRLYTTIHRRVWIMLKDLLKDDCAPEQTGFQVRFLEPATLGAYAAFRPEQRKEAARRLKEGHRAIIVCDGDRIAGSVWAATGRNYIPYLDRDIVLRPREMYTYDAFTHPDYRQRGIVAIRHSFLVPEYRRLGYHSAAAIVAFENQIGLRSAEAAGYRRVGVFSCMRLGIAQIDLTNPGSDDLPRLVSPLKRRAD